MSRITVLQIIATLKRMLALCAFAFVIAVAMISQPVNLAHADAFTNDGADTNGANSAETGAIPASAVSAPNGTSELAVANATGTGSTLKATKATRSKKKLVGLVKVNGAYRYYTPDGVMARKDVRVGEARLFINPNGKLIGAKLGSTYFYRTLKRMPYNDAYAFATFLKARSVLAKITNPKDSRKTKMFKAYQWVDSQLYVIRHDVNLDDPNWPAREARYVLKGQGGECHACSSALAYLFAAAGCTPWSLDVATTLAHPAAHSWAMIGDKVYDTLGEPDRFEVSIYETELEDGARYRLPFFYPENAPSGSKPAVKALMRGGSKNRWRTINGRKYYFKHNRPVTGSVKIGTSYYVFNESGALLEKRGASKTGSKANARRIVTVAGKRYRVNEKGKAAPGWSTDKKHRFNKQGELMTGISVVKSRFYAATPTGRYQEKLTKKLNKLAKAGTRATELRRLLGKPKRLYYSRSCEFAGDDGYWVYDNFAVSTRRPLKVRHTINQAIKHKNTTPYESIRMVLPLS